MRMALLVLLLGYVFPSASARLRRAQDAAQAAPDTFRTKPVYWLPLIGYVVPTLAIGYGMVIPRSCIAGINGLSLGFLATLGTLALAYLAGQQLLLRDARQAAAHGGGLHTPGAGLTLRWRYFAPVSLFVVANAGIGYGLVIPGSCIAGVNPVSIGFGMALLTGALTCLGGLLVVRGERNRARERAFLRQHPAFKPRALPPAALLPGLAFLAVTLGIGYGLVIPGSCIAGVNDLTIGFAAGMVAACLTCWAGIAEAVHGANARGMHAWPSDPPPYPVVLRPRSWIPLGIYQAITLATAFGLAIPGSCMAGVNGLSVGLLFALALTVPVYGLGLAMATRPAGAPGPGGPVAWLWRRIGRQARQPAGIWWRALYAIMARETRRDNERAVGLLGLQPDHAVLEVGFGHGRTLETLLQRTPQGRVSGADWSADAVARVNRRFT